MLRDHDVHTHQLLLFLRVLRASFSVLFFIFPFVYCILGFHHHCTTPGYYYFILLHLGKRGRIWKGGKGYSDFIIFLDQPAALLCKHNRFDSLLFSFVGENVLSKIKGSPDWILLHGPMHSNIETRNGIDIHEGGGAYAGLNI